MACLLGPFDVKKHQNSDALDCGLGYPDPKCPMSVQRDQYFCLKIFYLWQKWDVILWNFLSYLVKFYDFDKKWWIWFISSLLKNGGNCIKMTYFHWFLTFSDQKINKTHKITSDLLHEKIFEAQNLVPRDILGVLGVWISQTAI